MLHDLRRWKGGPGRPHGSTGRERETRTLRRIPLVPLADKLILNIAYLHALGAHPGAGETTP